MGLDSYIYGVPKGIDPNSENGLEGGDEVYYWRKHHDLHDWMFKNFGKDCKKDNCYAIPLRFEDLHTWFERAWNLEDNYYAETEIKAIAECFTYLKNNPNRQLYFWSWY